MHNVSPAPPALGAPGRPAGDAGFSMVEVIVAMVVFMVIVGAVAPMLQNHIRLAGTNTSRAAAANLAQQTLDQLRVSEGAGRPMGRSTQDITINKVPYTLTRDLRWITRAATAGSCDGGGGTTENLAYIRADVIVEWPNMQAKPVTSSTLIRPSRAEATVPGTIGVKVTLSGAPAPGQLVQLSLPSGGSMDQTTDRHGCAYFISMPFGNYTATVTVPGSPTRSQGIALTSGSPSVVSTLDFV